MLWLRVRAHCDAENHSSAYRAAAHTYRRRYPKGAFQGLASRIRTIPSKDRVWETPTRRDDHGKLRKGGIEGSFFSVVATVYQHDVGDE
ncbi:MAG: hypothetical protein GY811_08380 [Myxococcales bacterium]|nr:hypothetical protein [Myxococcales bacterium]